MGQRFRVEEDFVGQIQRINASTTGTARAKKICVEHKLSVPISYVYVHVLAQQQTELYGCTATMYEMGVGQTGVAGTLDTITQAELDAVDPVELGCGGTNDGGGELAIMTSDGKVARDMDIPAVWPRPIDTVNGGDILGGPPVANSYPRLREGIERFLITDINNPAGSAAAQSNIFVMFDAWTQAATRQWFGDGGIGRFNHIPGGSNVLFMDGHTEFIKLNQKVPMLSTALTGWGANEHSEGLNYWQITSEILGGFG
jgi:prepilin-type processing-associated H-X9-DG protein